MEAATMPGETGTELDELEAQAERIGMADGQTGAKRVEAPPEEIVVAGTTQLELIPGLGGKKPTGAKISLRGVGGIPLMQGQAVEKGDLVKFEVVARVEEVSQKDTVDRKVGVATDCKLVVIAHAVDVRLSAASSPTLD